MSIPIGHYWRLLSTYLRPQRRRVLVLFAADKLIREAEEASARRPKATKTEAPKKSSGEPKAKGAAKPKAPAAAKKPAAAKTPALKKPVPKKK
jgi:hypothetical protein